MNKTELIRSVAEKTGLRKIEAEAAVNAVLDCVSGAVSSGEDVRLSGFGTFEIKTRAKRQGVNPKTGEKIEIPEKDYVSFRAGSMMEVSADARRS